MAQLSDDTCVYVEATPGDGGNHDPNAQWWLSPDIELVDASGNPIGQAAASPATNTVQIRVHGPTGCQQLPGTTFINCDAYVGLPGLTPSANNKPITNPPTAPLPSVLVDPAQLTPQGFVVTIPWVAGTDSSAPDGPGHKCLVVRCYPNAVPVPGTSFNLPTERHAAQHNITVLAAAKKMIEETHLIVPNEDGFWPFVIQTDNINKENPERVRINASVDLHPSDVVNGAALPLLRQTPGFTRITDTAPPRFKFNLPDFPNAAVNDHSGPEDEGHGVIGRVEEAVEDVVEDIEAVLHHRRHGEGQSYEAEVELAAGQATKVEFLADLSHAQVGDAVIYHLRQIGRDGVDQGGMTLVYALVQ
jgi:hypothetical protein